MITDICDKELYVFLAVGRTIVVVQAHPLDGRVRDGASAIRCPVNVENWNLPREPYTCELMLSDEPWVDKYPFGPTVLQGGGVDFFSGQTADEFCFQGDRGGPSVASDSRETNRLRICTCT